MPDSKEKKSQAKDSQEDPKEVPGKLIAVIGDEETVVGFLLAGVGEKHKTLGPNYFIVTRDMLSNEVEDAFKDFLKRTDVEIILITQPAADMIRGLVDAKRPPNPAILEIPAKDTPYEPAKDWVLKRAKGACNPDDLR